MKKVFIICTSPRKGGNSEVLTDSFLKGAQEAGHRTITGLLGWISCFEQARLAGVIKGIGIDQVGRRKMRPNIFLPLMRWGKASSKGYYLLKL